MAGSWPHGYLCHPNVCHTHITQSRSSAHTARKFASSAQSLRHGRLADHHSQSNLRNGWFWHARVSGPASISVTATARCLTGPGHRGPPGRQDTPRVVLGHAVGQRGHRRIALGRRLVEGRLIILDELVVLHSRVVQNLKRLTRQAQPRGV
jgi:hypothetical protein